MSVSGQNNVDLDSLLDLTEYDGMGNQSLSPSPSATSKATFASPVSATIQTPNVGPATTQTLSGPSHNYDMYRQQTGFVPGALTNTMAVNQSNNTGYQDFGSLDYISGMSPENDIFDFNSSNSQGHMPASEMELEYESGAADLQGFFPTINPSNIQQEGNMPHTGNTSSPDDDKHFAASNLPRSKKEEEEMDEDERLLASEEGKKLSSKERRQLRNKVSARAFRSRRKEYITQLEAEIAGKVNENGDLRAQNRALLDENKRLTDLTRMLLSSPSFSNFLDDLSSNPAAASASASQGAAPVKMEPQQQQQQQQQQGERQQPKDVGSYGSQQSQQQIGMAMIPEQAMDFSMLTLDGAYNFQPQVFVVDNLDIASPIDTAVLSGKTTNFVDQSLPESDDDKMEIHAIERAPVDNNDNKATTSAPIDEEFESDPDFALYHSEPIETITNKQEEQDDDELSANIFGGVVPEKVLARYQLVDATEEEASAAVSMARVQRISENVESIVSRLELLTMDIKSV
ncbi:hypothetical protein GMORB2_6464 [Geosmithia morbida]|uniref:BZIP domain-containing protein n=1 Tax=Geosmithia morbida TaxID=1094350 RepID=A0A9P4YY06_9HYPO|nr:uncharacterized protein GMORB2_6464 [Geosmithia morbida]KAF4123763.1 hypothetical protein GMORB2_6464 [Geosmithia morbida]